MKTVLKFCKYWVPFFAWAFVVYLFSSYTTGKASQVHWEDFIVKKTAHMVEYAIFSILLYRANISYGMDKRNAFWVSIAAAVIYGLTDEFHQAFTPGREPRLRDVGFDTIGAAIGVFSIWNIIPRMPKQLRSLAEKLDLH